MNTGMRVKAISVKEYHFGATKEITITVLYATSISIAIRSPECLPENKQL